MIVRFITCRVKEGREVEFEAASATNREGSIGEAGVLRFDVLKDAAEKGLYYLYEVYRDEAATLVHKETNHYKTWREAVAPLMAADRTSVTCSVVVPKAESEWAHLGR